MASILGGICVMVLAWSLLPILPSTAAIPISLAGASAKGLPGQVEFIWQAWMRLGEPAQVSLRLPEMEAPSLPAIAIAEAVLEVNGAEITPGFNLRQTVTPGKEITFSWQVWGMQPGELNGRAWLFWTVVTDGKEERLPVLARPVALQVEAFLGLPVWMARLIGALGLLGATGLACLKPAWGRKKSR